VLSFSAGCSVVGVLDDPALELQPARLSDHAGAQPELSELVVEEDGNVEREGWHAEVGEADLSGTEGDVEEWNVEKEGDEGGLEEESEVTHGVHHKLLGEGQVSGLADHQIGPLDDDDGDEVTGLSILEGFGGVADWISVGNVGELVEFWESSWLERVPSALGPGIWLSDGALRVSFILVGVEQSDIEFGVVGHIPCKSSGVIHEVIRLPWVLLSSENVVKESIGVVTVTISRKFAINHGILTITIGTKVHISGSWKWSSLKSKSPNCSWFDTEIVQNEEVGIHTGGSLNDTDLEVSE
jgi:hypothetical protein